MSVSTAPMIAYAGDTSQALNDDCINIRSMLDPDSSISKKDPLSISLPANPTVADKQLLHLVRMNLIADGFHITSADQSKWTMVVHVSDNFTRDTYYKSGIVSPSTMTEITNYASLAVAVFKTADSSDPAWVSSVYTLNDNWVNDQENVVAAIVATYGTNFYYLNVHADNVPKYVRRNKSQPSVPTQEQIKSIWQEYEGCVQNPEAKSC